MKTVIELLNNKITEYQNWIKRYTEDINQSIVQFNIANNHIDTYSIKIKECEEALEKLK